MQIQGVRPLLYVPELNFCIVLMIMCLSPQHTSDDPVASRGWSQCQSYAEVSSISQMLWSQQSVYCWFSKHVSGGVQQRHRAVTGSALSLQTVQKHWPWLVWDDEWGPFNKKKKGISCHCSLWQRTQLNGWCFCDLLKTSDFTAVFRFQVCTYLNRLRACGNMAVLRALPVTLLTADGN